MKIVYKEIGETPLQTIDRFRSEHTPLYSGVALSYAGRLDPMAEGLLLVLIGEENKEREKYLGLNKRYEVELLFGVTSDSYDVLGEVCVGAPEKIQHINLQKHIQDFLKNIVGTFVQEYPPYSSKPVQGKPLFQWAKEGRLGEIVIPTNTVKIYEAELIQVFRKTTKEIVETAIENIQKVEGDFRQELCIQSWQNITQSFPSPEMYIATIKISCGSGTYMRSLAHQMGKEIGCGAIAYNIKRTRIGDFSEQNIAR